MRKGMLCLALAFPIFCQAETIQEVPDRWLWPIEHQTPLIREFIQKILVINDEIPRHDYRVWASTSELMLESVDPIDNIYGLLIQLNIDREQGKKEEDKLLFDSERARILLGNEDLPDLVKLSVFVKLVSIYRSFQLPQQQVIVAQQAYQLMNRLGSSSSEKKCGTISSLGQSLLRLGEHDSAEHYIREAYHCVIDAGLTGYRAASKVNSYGYLLLEVGRPELAETVLKQAMGLIQPGDHPSVCHQRDG